tara:strand:+ start:21003 stop:22355 length:1353 start_codon:yes stop_codon:yes gene_type:complete
MAAKYTAIKLKGGAIGVAKNNDYKNAQIFRLKGDQYSKPKVGATFQPNKDFEKKYDKGEGKKANLTNAFGGGKGNRSNTGADFKGKSGNTQQKLAKPTIRVKDREVSGVPITSSEVAVRRIATGDFEDKQVGRAFQKWAGVKKMKDGEYDFQRDDKTMGKVYNDYITVKTASSNSTQYLKNNDPESALEEYTDASLAASRLPKEIRNIKSVGGGTFFGKGYVGTIEKNFKTASKQAGYGAADKAYKTGWFGRKSIAAKIEDSNREAMKIQAEADVEEAKALKEEGKERSTRAKNARIAEIAADRKASASFLNKITGGLVGRESLADLRVRAERAEAEAALKTAKQEGRAAEESAKAQRRAISVQSEAFGARQRAQRLEQKELERLEERSAEGRPITKADKARLKFIREFSEETPSSFARGESQVRSVIAPDAETIQAAKDFERRKRGSKK